MAKFFALAWAFLIWYLTSLPDLTLAPNAFLANLFSSSAHLTFFGVQAVLLKLALSPGGQQTTLPLALTSFYGIVIELNQTTIPGRSADPFDWLLDTLGAYVFLAILTARKPRK